MPSLLQPLELIVHVIIKLLTHEWTQPLNAHYLASSVSMKKD